MSVINIKFGKILFYTFWGIVVVGKGLGYTSADSVFQNMAWIAIIFASYKIIITKFSRRTMLICFLLNLMALMIWLCSGSTTVLLTTITISAMQDMRCSSIFKFSFWILGILFVLRTTLAILGILDVQQRYFFSDGTLRIRYALGYGQPNSTHFVLFVVIALCVLAYSKRIKIYHYFMMLAYNCFIFSYTDSRAGFSVTTLFILLCLLSSSRFANKILYRFFRFWSRKAFIITSVASVIIAQLFLRVDILREWGTFSSRFQTAFYVINNNNIALFGNSGISTDFAMINFLYSDGLVFFILFVVGYYFLLKRYSGKKDLQFMIACCCYAVYCLAEAYADSVLMNITLLMFGEYIYHTKAIDIAYKEPSH